MLQTKALYNLLRLNAAEDPTIQADPWALEDLRSIEIPELFSRLEREKIKIEKSSFLQFAKQCDTPEELAELLFPDSSSEKRKDAFYLVVFELWRRLLPEKQSLSIFCDELDHRIALYDEGTLENDELIQDALANLLEVLEENADTGADPQEIFKAISDYCAHDLENFIYDYISDLLDNKNTLYASELIEGYFPYVTESLWFRFLRIRFLASSDIGAANLEMSRLLNEKMGFSLLLEIVRFLVGAGEHELFKKAVQKALPFVKKQEELIEIMQEVAKYYRLLDEDEKEKAIQKMIDLKQADLKLLQELLC